MNRGLVEGDSRSFLHYIIIIPVLKAITQKREIIEEELMDKTTEINSLQTEITTLELVCQVKNKNSCIRSSTW